MYRPAATSLPRRGNPHLPRPAAFPRGVYLAFPEVGAEKEKINNPRGNAAGIDTRGATFASLPL